jgi:hypothetical protein
VQVEHAVEPDFLTQLGDLVLRKRLARIIIDEAHVLITWSTFRPVMYRLYILQTLGVPFVFFTATLPVELEQNLVENFHLSSDSLLILRYSTVRHNMKLSVKKLSAERELHHSQVIQGLSELLGSITHKVIHGIIFCQRKSDIDSLFRLISNRYHDWTICKYYASNNVIDEEFSMDHVQREENYHLWKSKPRTIMLATSAFSIGIDDPNVPFILHYRASNTLIDYCQEIGRGGRDGTLWKCVLFLSPDDRVTDKSLLEYISTKRCRKQVIFKYMDSIQVNCKESEGALCDNCSREHLTTSFPFTLDSHPDVPKISNYQSIAATGSNIVAESHVVSYDIAMLDSIALGIREFFTSPICTICLLKHSLHVSHVGGIAKCPLLNGKCFKCFGNHPSKTCKENYLRFDGACTHCRLPRRLGSETLCTGAGMLNCPFRLHSDIIPFTLLYICRNKSDFSRKGFIFDGNH